MIEKHHSTNVQCNTSGREVSESELGEHMNKHEMFSNSKKGLERNPKPTPKSKSKTPTKSKAPAKKKAVNCYLAKVKAGEINRQDDGDKEIDEAECPKCGNKFPSKDAVIFHIARST